MQQQGFYTPVVSARWKWAAKQHKLTLGAGHCSSCLRISLCWPENLCLKRHRFHSSLYSLGCINSIVVLFRDAPVGFWVQTTMTNGDAGGHSVSLYVHLLLHSTSFLASLPHPIFRMPQKETREGGSQPRISLLSGTEEQTQQLSGGRGMHAKSHTFKAASWCASETPRRTVLARPDPIQ